jgi:glucose/arabinose dehydrogenase
VLFDNLEFPTGIAFGFGKMFINERAGRIRVVENGRLSPEPLATIPTETDGERGLLGIAAPPDAADRAVYVFATDPGGDSNSMWRVPLDGDPPTAVVEGLPGSGYHDGGGVAFDRDGMLLVSNGEAHNSDLSQDPNALGGKVYRYTPAGDIPDDNPFPGSPALSIGHRNPFGLTVDPVTGTPWVTENGPGSFDEINRIEAGRNYGWPVVSGPDCAAATGLDDCVDPAISYEDVIVPTGITFAPANAPAAVAGHLFFGAYGVPAIHELTLDESRQEVVSDDLLASGESSIVAVAWGPNGLYYSTTTAVKLIPFASSGAKSQKTPRPTPSPSPGDEGGGASTVGFALVIVVFLALYAASRRRLTR